ncbi:MAG: hypothetical protein H7X71_05235 [Chitinophagales bacterium]|nr:hypothetical protein [Chitinophagales bacterium]
MKKIYLPSSALFFLLFSAFKTTNMCTAYATYKYGTSWEVTTYNDEDELVSTTTYTVQEIRKEAERTSIMNEYVTTNKKGKQSDKGYMSIILSGNNYLLNLSSMIPGYKSDDPQFIQYSCTPKTGDDIPEFSKVTTFATDNMGQISIVSNKVGLEDGKYGEMETITTALGTFNSIKISYKIRLDMHDYVFTEWIDEGGRTLKTQRMDNKGKLDTYSVLTKFSNE